MALKKQNQLLEFSKSTQEVRILGAVYIKDKLNPEILEYHFISLGVFSNILHVLQFFSSEENILF